MTHFACNRRTLLFVRLFFWAAGMVTGLVLVQPAAAQSDDVAAKHFVTPTVFQAAGPSAASIQSTVDQFRAALGAVNNGNNPGQPADAVKSTGMAVARPTQPLLLAAHP